VSDLIARIADRYAPRRIVLFGSHARGEANADSDVDLLVVMDTELRPLRQAMEISRDIRREVPADFFVRTPDQVEQPDPRDVMLRIMLEEGVTVYEAKH